MQIATNIPLMMKSRCAYCFASSDKYGLNKIGFKYRCRCSSIAGGKGVSMVNQILTADAFILVTSTCTHGIQGRPQAIRQSSYPCW